MSNYIDFVASDLAQVRQELACLVDRAEALDDLLKFTEAVASSNNTFVVSDIDVADALDRLPEVDRARIRSIFFRAFPENPIRED